MGWRRQRSHLQVVPRADDGSPAIDPREADRIREQVKAELAPVDGGPFPVAEYTARYNAALARRCEIAALQQARRLPVTLTATTAAAGAGGWGAAALAEWLAGPAGHLIASAATPTAALVAIGAVRLAHRQRISEWSGTFKAASIGAVGWIGMVTALPLGWWSWLLAAGLVGGATVVSQPWMRAHTAPLQLPPAPSRHEIPPAPEDGPAVELDDIQAFIRDWHQDVACPNGKAAGSALTGGRRFDNGLEYDLVLAGGMTLQQVQSRAVEIASELDCDPLQLVFDDPPPDPSGWRSARRAKLRYVTRSPITRVVDWTAPCYSDGRLGIGPHADGQDWGEWVLFSENSMRNGVIIGSTGSGKSGAINGLVASARASGRVVTIYFDPKMNSSPELAQTATVSVLGLDRAEEFTAAVEALLHGRRLKFGINDWSGFEPTEEDPGYLIVIDECDMLFTLPGMAPRWGMVAKTDRALGAGVLGATQIDGVMAFGNNEMLRSNMVRNVLLMRTESASSGGKLIAPELPSSRTLPKVPGYAYLQAEGARRAALRAAYLRSAQNCPDGFNALTALQQHADAPMCEIGRRAFAAFLAGSQEERRELDKQRMQVQLAEFLGGRANQAASVARSAPGFEDLIGQVPAALTADNVIPIRRGEYGRPATAGEMQAVAAGTDPRLNGSDRRMLAAVYLGHTRSYLIVHHTGLSGPQVSNAGKKLAGLGYLRDGGHGVWTTPEEVGA